MNESGEVGILKLSDGTDQQDNAHNIELVNLKIKKRRRYVQGDFLASSWALDNIDEINPNKSESSAERENMRFCQFFAAAAVN